MLVLVVLSSALSAPAQSDLATLKKLMKEKDFQTVLRRVKGLAASSKATVETALLGAHAARELGEWGQAGSLGSLATELAPLGPDGRPAEHRGFEAEAHALWGAAREVLVSGRPSELTRASFLDAGLFYRRARRHGGDAFTNGFFEAEAYRLGTKFEEALVGIEAALEAQGDHWDALILKARLLVDLKRHGEAITLLTALRQRQEDDPDAAHLLFTATMGTEDRARIATTFVELIRVFPRDMVIYRLFADRFATDTPVTFFKQTMEATAALRPVGEDRMPSYYLSYAAEREQRFEDALAHMVAYRDAIPTMADGHLYVARLLATRLGRHEAAHQSILKASALGGLDDDALVVGFGNVIGGYARSNKFGPAIDLQKIVVSIKRDAGSELNLARLMYQGGRRTEAVELMERVLKGRDGFDDGLIAEMENDLALYFLGLGKDVEAEKALRRSIEASTEKLDGTENLGIYLLERGKKTEGMKLLEACLAREPERHRSRYHLLLARYPGVFGAGER